MLTLSIKWQNISKLDSGLTLKHFLPSKDGPGSYMKKRQDINQTIRVKQN